MVDKQTFTLTHCHQARAIHQKIRQTPEHHVFYSMASREYKTSGYILHRPPCPRSKSLGGKINSLQQVKHLFCLIHIKFRKKVALKLWPREAFHRRSHHCTPLETPTQPRLETLGFQLKQKVKIVLTARAAFRIQHSFTSQSVNPGSNYCASFHCCQQFKSSRFGGGGGVVFFPHLHSLFCLPPSASSCLFATVTSCRSLPLDQGRLPLG